MGGGAWWAAVHGVAKSWTQLSDFTFTFHFHALQKEMATCSSILAWRIPGMGEPGGLLSMGSHSQTRLKGLSSSSTRDAGSRLGCSKGVICLGQWFLTLAADAYPLPPRNSLSRGCPCPGISRAQNKPPGHSLLLTVDMGSARLSVLLHLPQSTAQTLNKHWFVSDDSR